MWVVWLFRYFGLFMVSMSVLLFRYFGLGLFVGSSALFAIAVGLISVVFWYFGLVGLIAFSVGGFYLCCYFLYMFALV